MASISIKTLYYSVSTKHFVKLVSYYSSASKSLDIYDHIAFRESPNYKEKLSPSFEAWNEVVQNENDYIYRYIHKRLHNRISDIASSVADMPLNSQLERLRKLCEQVKSPDERQNSHKEEIARIIQEFKSQMEVMNQLELAGLLTAIKNQHEYEFRSIKRMIDMELRWLLKKNVKTRLVDLDLWLYIADIFYESKIKSTFNHVLLNYLTAESDVIMSNRQLIHMLFLVILKRQQDGLLSKYESRIYDLLRKAPIEDISIICMAYFKTKTQIGNHALLRRIIDRTRDHLPNIDPEQPGYGSIIKSIRYSRHPDLRENVILLTDALLLDENKRIIFASPYNSVQTIKLMEAYRIYKPNLLDHFWQYLFRGLSKFRTKDIQYGLTTLSNFAYRNFELTDDKIKDIDRLVLRTISLNHEEKLRQQILHVMPTARALATFGYYDDKLTIFLNQCLNDPVKFDIMKNVLEFEKTTLLLHTATLVEGGREKLEIKTEIASVIMKKIDRSICDVGSARFNSLNHLSSILKSPEYKKKFIFTSQFNDIARALSSREELIRPDYEFNFQFTMPHQNYVDLVISYKAKNPGCFDPQTLKPKTVPLGESHIIVFGIHNSDYIDGASRLCGYKRLLIRLLRKLGYEVLLTNLSDPDIDSLAKLIINHFSR